MGQRGNNAACWALCWFSVISPATQKQIRPFWCLFPGGWVCVHSRTLWVSPTISGEFVTLGVSPTAASTPTGVFSQSLTLLPCTGPLACVVCLAPQLFFPVYPQANVGPPSPQSATSTGPTSCHLAASPLCLGCLSLPLLPVWMNVSSFNSLVVRLPYSLIFWQFWLFFVFKFVVFLLLVV